MSTSSSPLVSSRAPHVDADGDVSSSFTPLDSPLSSLSHSSLSLSFTRSLAQRALKYFRDEPLSLLLFAGPPALFFRCTGSEPTAQFLLSSCAIIPLAGLLGEATEHLSDNLGPASGGLLNASFGNAAELIIGSFSVSRGLDTLVKSSLVGSILGNLLLVLGASTLCGGMRYSSQKFSINAANIDATMSVVAAIGFLVPSMFHHFGTLVESKHEHALSLGISLIFLSTYVFMLYFQLKTHSYMFDKPLFTDNISSDSNGKATSSDGRGASMTEDAPLLRRGSALSSARNSLAPRLSSFTIPRSTRRVVGRSESSKRDEARTASGALTPKEQKPVMPNLERLAQQVEKQGSMTRTPRDEYGGALVHVFEEDRDPDDDVTGELMPYLVHPVWNETDSWSFRKSISILGLSALCIVILSEILTGAVEIAGEALGLSELFVGTVLIAICGNAAEHLTAVSAALHNEMDIAIAISFGSALQISMVVMPVVVLISYLRDAKYGPMDLALSEFESFSVVCSSIISWMVVVDGASTWLEGVMLLVIYFIIALAFFYS